MPKVAIHVFARRPYSFEPEEERGEYIYSYEVKTDLESNPTYIPSEHAYVEKMIVDLPHELLNHKTFALNRLDAIERAESEHRAQHHELMTRLREERESLLAITYQPEPKETQIYEQETVGTTDTDSDADGGSEGGSGDMPF